ncbi:TetR/AcrR family transcriptional regulator [Virgibacillus soli]|uniref:TetR/AcrR family transcriptional regulator n=1 Tax=Paracerasibacillus soli TaxID=480284 RepID=A0ABU5CW25_9BACI|nr:TetR/AcrR family transcriptional regulator [Virgibacillus soli]MDY0410572.1 TetR/AcrR family transcriptional regulator [Virgibacillus soli]
MSSKKTSREKILEAATLLFHLKGYHATGLSQILKVSGAPKGSLYYHFPDGKEQLAIEAIHLSAKTISTAIKENLSTHNDPIKAFQYHIGNIAEIFRDMEKRTQFKNVPLGLLAMETVFVNENLRQACEETFTMWENLYYDKLRMSGYNEDCACLISKTISALIEGGVTLCFTKKSSEPLHNVNKMIPLLLSQ